MLRNSAHHCWLPIRVPRCAEVVWRAWWPKRGSRPEGLVAGLVEFISGAFIALGLLTRVAAFTASGEMAVAYFKAHAGRSFWPILNHGELAVLYCFVFLYICFRGAGLWSVERLRAADTGET